MSLIGICRLCEGMMIVGVGLQLRIHVCLLRFTLAAKARKTGPSAVRPNRESNMIGVSTPEGSVEYSAEPGPKSFFEPLGLPGRSEPRVLEIFYAMWLSSANLNEKHETWTKLSKHTS